MADNNNFDGRGFKPRKIRSYDIEDTMSTRVYGERPEEPSIFHDDPEPIRGAVREAPAMRRFDEIDDSEYTDDADAFLHELGPDPDYAPITESGEYFEGDDTDYMEDLGPDPAYAPITEAGLEAERGYADGYADDYQYDYADEYADDDPNAGLYAGSAYDGDDDGDPALYDDDPNAGLYAEAAYYEDDAPEYAEEGAYDYSGESYDEYADDQLYEDEPVYEDDVPYEDDGIPLAASAATAAAAAGIAASASEAEDQKSEKPKKVKKSRDLNNFDAGKAHEHFDDEPPKKKKKSKKPVIFAIVAVLVVALGAAAFFLLRPTTLSADEQNDLIANGTYLQGVSVNGISVGGMTKDQAKTAIEADIAAKQAAQVISVSAGELTYTMDDPYFVMENDLDAVLNEAMLYGRDSSIIMKNSDMERIAAEGKDYPLTFKIDEAAVKNDIAAAALALNTLPVEPTLAIDINAEHKVSVVPGATGISLDENAMYEQVVQRLNNGDYSPLAAPCTEIQPTVSEEELRHNTQLRTSFFSSYAKSPYNDKNRVKNILKCVEIINSTATVLEPGAEFDVNAVLGPRKAGEWAMAPGYTGGRSVDQPGGGVCQVSTTLYQAAMLADLEIVERKNHSIPIGYAEMGLDATISTGGPNLIFKNDTAHTIYIFLWTTENKELHCEIYGEPFEGFDEIKLESYRIRRIEPSGEPKYTVDVNKDPGYKEEYVPRRTGSEWGARKIYYLNGQEVKREDCHKSTYRAYAGEYIVGPSASPTVAPSPTKRPTEQPTVTERPVSTPTVKPTEPPPEDTPEPVDTPEPSDEEIAG